MTILGIMLFGLGVVFFIISIKVDSTESFIMNAMFGMFSLAIGVTLYAVSVSEETYEEQSSKFEKTIIEIKLEKGRRNEFSDKCGNTYIFMFSNQ